MTNMTTPDTLDICIAGRWQQGRGQRYDTCYPATGEVVASLNAASEADVEDAIQGAQRAFETSGWAQRRPHERAQVLYRIAQLIRENAENLAQRQRLDNGKPILETRALVASAANTFQFFAAACETMEESITPARGDYLSMSVYDAMGVVAAITPWNSPIASEAQKIAPALAAGNAVVVKPAQITPLMALDLARLCIEAGLPEGLISVLPGSGSTIGDAITRHPLVRRVSFTGGTSVGRHIAQIAAQKMMSVSLELGGKSPTIVLDDADIDHAIAGVLYGIFSSSGESCIAGSRLFVARALFERFVERLVAGAEKLRVGDPASEHTQMGPLANAPHYQRVLSCIADATHEGAKLALGGKPHADASGGLFVQPTIFRDVDNRSQLAQREVFGPVLAVIPFETEAGALALANGTHYGLGAGLWTKDMARVFRFSKGLQAGTVWVNTYRAVSYIAPFGGVKASGLGRENGQEMIKAYMQTKTVWINNSTQPPGNPFVMRLS